ncbi:MAG: PspC domain-containing protein [Bacteroidales bacterium]|nr:PspC domain-containing protein [Bacteroidales bacterium]
MEKKQKLRRSQSNKMIAGICGGLAKYFGLDASLLRIIYVLVTIFTAFAGVLLYIILWIIVPVENDDESLEKLE